MPEVHTFALVQGFGHDKWHWHLLQSELNNLGHKTIVMDLPLSSPSSTFDTYGEIIADYINNKEDVMGVFHSRAGNYGPRAANILNKRYPGKVSLSKLIFLCSSFEAATMHALNRPRTNERVPLRNTPESRRVIVDRKDLGDNVKEFDPSLAAQFLYHDINDEFLVLNAVKHLGPQNRPAHEPKLDVWPVIEHHYIYAEDDRMVRPEWSKYVATNWLKTEPIPIAGGHSPFLSRPNELAKLLIELAS